MTRPSVFTVVVLELLLLGAAGAGGNWYARHRASGDLTAHADSLKVVLSARDTTAARVAQLEQYAAAQHAIAVTAAAKADSLTGLAERHRTRNRVVDSTHVAITTSDTDQVAQIVEVPIQLTEQLALDSAALAGQDARGVSDGKLLAVQGQELSALKTQVRLDSLAMHHLESEVADLTALKTPRFTFTEGVVTTLSVIAIVKLLALVLPH